MAILASGKLHACSCLQPGGSVSTVYDCDCVCHQDKGVMAVRRADLEALMEAAEALAIDAESAAFILQHKHPSEYPETGKRLRHSLDAISEAIAKAREAQKGEA